jgi:hypothetical protein
MDDPIVVRVPFWALKSWSINDSKRFFKRVPKKQLRLNSEDFFKRILKKIRTRPRSSVQQFITKKSRIKPECLPLVEKMLSERRANRKQNSTPGLLMGMIIYIDDKDPKNNFSIEMKGPL